MSRQKRSSSSSSLSISFPFLGPSFPLLPSPTLTSSLDLHYTQYWWWYHMACSWTTGAVTRDSCSHQNVYVWDWPLLQTGGRDWTRNRSPTSL